VAGQKIVVTQSVGELLGKIKHVGHLHLGDAAS
jgi:hypothetical protein